MAVKLVAEDASDWAYRGEGAANLVLSYAGSSPAFIGKVMRIQKVDRNGTPLEAEEETVLTEEERQVWRDFKELVTSPNKGRAEQLYVQLVMSPLLGPSHVDAGARVLVSPEFLESVQRKVLSQRPSWRVEAASVDTDRDTVMLMSDHSVFSGGIAEDGICLSVEIKPKCGFLPDSKFISDANAIKRTTTRFRMHQLLKLRDKEIAELSQYNPLDLFSGSKERILKAINDLYSTPQNNFRVFLNGSLVFGGLGGGTKKTTVLVGEAFENVLKGIIWADDGLRTMYFLQLVAETVYNSGVLDRLLAVQKQDNLDIEATIHAYYNVISQSCAACRELDGANLSQKYASLHSIPMEKSLKIVRDYLIAATAKDCSLMISFRQRKDGETRSPYSSIYLQPTNQNFDFKMNFFDLDLKPLKKIEDYYELDKRILSCYTQIGGNGSLKKQHSGQGGCETAE